MDLVRSIAAHKYEPLSVRCTFERNVTMSRHSMINTLLRLDLSKSIHRIYMNRNAIGYGRSEHRNLAKSGLCFPFCAVACLTIPLLCLKTLCYLQYLRLGLSVLNQFYLYYNKLFTKQITNKLSFFRILLRMNKSTKDLNKRRKSWTKTKSIKHQRYQRDERVKRVFTAASAKRDLSATFVWHRRWAHTHLAVSSLQCCIGHCSF